MTVLSPLLSSSSFKSDEGLLSGCCGWTGEWAVNNLVQTLERVSKLTWFKMGWIPQTCACVCVCVFEEAYKPVGWLCLCWTSMMSLPNFVCAVPPAFVRFALWPTAAEPAGRKLAGQPPSQQCCHDVFTKGRNAQLKNGPESGWMYYSSLQLWRLDAASNDLSWINE